MRACPHCRKLFPDDANECPDHRRALVALEELPEEDPPLEPGTMVGEYRVDHKLGSGTFGDVYAGEQPLIGKQVAIKVLHRKFSSNNAVVSRFVAEARAVNRIRHRNIIDIFSFGLREDEQPYFVMERLLGMTLGDLLERDGRLTVAVALPLLRGIAAGLDAAHEAGITHRDLKPDNIFLVKEKGGGFSPKILDFGVAKLVDEELVHKTATGAAIGTPSYMAPEQCRGRDVDHRADVYALGVVIHQMLTGQRLFSAESAMEVLFMHMSEPPPPMSSVRADLPRELDAPVLAMLAKVPAQRPSSAGAAVESLASAAGRAGMTEGEAGAGASTTLRDSGTPTLLDGPRAPSASTTPTMTSPRGASAETSGPVVISVGDATATDPDAASARTMVVPSSPASGTLVAGGPPSSAMMPSAASASATGIGAPAPPPQPSHHASPARARVWPFALAGVAVVAAIAASQRREPARPEPAPGAAESARPAEVAPARVTLRLSVTPVDADVIVDGLRAGAASDPLVLPRAVETRAIRVEKAGFEPQTLWIVPDRDRELPPLSLRPVVVPQIPSAGPKPPPRPVHHDDLERPAELARPK